MYDSQYHPYSFEPNPPGISDMQGLDQDSDSESSSSENLSSQQSIPDQLYNKGGYVHQNLPVANTGYNHPIFQPQPPFIFPPPPIMNQGKGSFVLPPLNYPPPPIINQGTSTSVPPPLILNPPPMNNLGNFSSEPLPIKFPPPPAITNQSIITLPPPNTSNAPIPSLFKVPLPLANNTGNNLSSPSPFLPLSAGKNEFSNNPTPPSYPNLNQTADTSKDSNIPPILGNSFSGNNSHTQVSNTENIKSREKLSLENRIKGIYPVYSEPNNEENDLPSPQITIKKGQIKELIPPNNSESINLDPEVMKKVPAQYTKENTFDSPFSPMSGPKVNKNQVKPLIENHNPLVNDEKDFVEKEKVIPPNIIQSHKNNPKNDGIDTQRNSEEIKESDATYLNHNKYTEKFLSNFRGFQIKKSFCEKICSCGETNLKRLRKLKVHYFSKTDAEVINFICLHYNLLTEDQIKKYSVIDLYMVGSLLEIQGLRVFICNNQSLLDNVKKATDEAIGMLHPKKVNDQDVAKLFFEKTRIFLIRTIKKGHNSFDEKGYEELRSLLSSN